MVDQGAIYLVKVLAAQVGIEPSELCLVALVSGPVLCLLNPAQDSFFPKMPRLYAEALLFPSSGLEPVVDLLRLASVGSPSALL